MKKSTKKTIMALSIVLVFGMSSIAYVVVSFTGGPVQSEFKPLDNFVVDGELEPTTAYQYYSWGYTFLKFYYTDDIPDFINSLPDMFMTSDSRVQLIVEKIPANDTYINIMNFNSEETVYNLTEEAVYEALCNTLLVTPIDCLDFDLETAITSTENDTGNETNNTNASA